MEDPPPDALWMSRMSPPPPRGGDPSRDVSVSEAVSEVPPAHWTDAFCSPVAWPPSLLLDCATVFRWLVAVLSLVY